MAGPNPSPPEPYYTPTSKPQPPLPHWKKLKIFRFSVIALLCSLFYLLGTWQHGGTTTTTTTTLLTTSTLQCTPNKTTTPLPTTTTTMDFTTHHAAVADGGTAPTAAAYPPCNGAYSEYTPCEDGKRSLKFQRTRLIYRERHCPGIGEQLKCRVPAPHGYKTPFKWPLSRDLVWYANVPHKELTVEKAVQNWIRFEGDRFRFPGGGTMFPNGADAYIDDIRNKIQLKRKSFYAW